ncbi:MAG: Thymidylate synthase [Peltula sp. TS41687]|nr:MAG: Thymidylate synthase [Peltula sp. TS41687]
MATTTSSLDTNDGKQAPNANAIANADDTKDQKTVSNLRIIHEEYQYLDLIRKILAEGEHRPDRTGTGTRSIFAPSALRFSLSSSPDDTLILPLLTTKRVFLRAVIAELLWFISGSTSSRTLSAQGIKIWDGNGSREFLDRVGLSHREAGDLGPVYGFQWRHFGATYVDAKTDYTGQGVDQLADVIHKLVHSPSDRRIILSAWNPADLTKMALPPCHMFAQFYVRHPESDPVLDCQLYQRSADMGLGVPFNIASYALLTHMLAFACGMRPGSFTHVLGDAHVYLDHVDALREQLDRTPTPFPELIISRPPETFGLAKKESVGVKAIEGWQVKDFEIRGYNPGKSIAMKMAV